MRTGIFKRRKPGAVAAFGLALAAASAGAADTDPPHLGIAATAADIASHNKMIFPDGEGLPPGRGSAADGAQLYLKLCVSCHGVKGRGGPGGELAGATRALTSDTPDRTIGSYWPYATTLFDFIRRAMPMTAPGTLSDDEVYALAAYLLALNGIVPTDAVLDAASLAAIEMPNRHGFIPIDVPPED